MTDGGHQIIDCHFDAIDDIEALELRLKRIVGVFETGLFLGLCDLMIVGHPDVIDGERLGLKFTDACDAILEGSRQTLRHDGCPVVLCERETSLATLGIDVRGPRRMFGRRCRPCRCHVIVPRETTRDDSPAGAGRDMDSGPRLPEARLPYTLASRQAGVGSLGQRRFVAMLNGRTASSRGKSNDEALGVRLAGARGRDASLVLSTRD